jgi:hypothetical protein
MTRATERLRRLYGPPDSVMPTKLGNVLRAGEHRAGARYGLETVSAWPRLYPLLPPNVRSLIDDQRLQLDLSARFCAVFAAASVLGLALLAPHGWWLAVPAGTLALALLAYRGAITAAIAYSEGLDTAFDLCRFDLLTALHLPLPSTREEELTANADLSAFLVQGEDIDFPYEHPGNRTGETAA